MGCFFPSLLHHMAGDSIRNGNGVGDICNGSCGNHGTCVGGTSPVDIARTGGSWNLYLRVNYPTVKSIKTYVELRCCTGCATKYRRTIKVKLYQCPNAIGYIGTVMYAHVDNPQVAHNKVYNLTSSSKKLGTMPTGSCGGCYTGPHSHMERSGGSTSAPCCATDVSTSTKIYSWTFTPFPVCPTSPEK